jgi:hypothetical protein
MGLVIIEFSVVVASREIGEPGTVKAKVIIISKVAVLRKVMAGETTNGSHPSLLAPSEFVGGLGLLLGHFLKFLF